MLQIVFNEVSAAEISLLDTLEQQLARIERYRENGVPLELGLWLYQGEDMHDPLKQSPADVLS